jgi:hypothetical protein
MPALRPWTAGPPRAASPDSAGGEPQGPTGGTDYGLVMPQSVWCQGLLRRHYERAALAPKGAVRVRSAWDLPGAGHSPARGLPWCLPPSTWTPMACREAPIHRPCWTLTSPSYRDTIPITICPSGGAAAPCNCVLSTWLRHMDKTLFVGWPAPRVAGGGCPHERWCGSVARGVRDAGRASGAGGGPPGALGAGRRRAGLTPPNFALERTGHSGRVLAGTGRCPVARRSPRPLAG